MAQQKISKSVYSKSAVFLNKTHLTLQVAISQALDKAKKVGLRKETLPDNENYIRAIIYHRPYAGMHFGIFASYEKGTNQLTVKEDDDAELLKVEHVAPPLSEDKKRQEFLEGLCYFCIYKNHIVLAPSRALGIKQAELHFNWLLTQTKVIDTENRVAFSDQIAQATKEKIIKSHVKQVEIGAPLIDQVEATEETSSTGLMNKAIEYKGVGIDILQKLLGEDKFSKLNLSEALDGNIEVSLRIRYNRTTTKNGHKFLDNIALSLRNIDEDEVKLELVGGGRIEGKDLKLSTILRVNGRDGIPIADELFEHMRQWLDQQITNKIITP